MGFWMMFLFWAGTTILSALLKPKSESQKPAGIGDFQFPTATEGRPVPILWGTVPIAGPNVVWYGDLKQEAILLETPGLQGLIQGLFGDEGAVIGFRYHVGIQFALCRGIDDDPIDELLRIWIGDEEVFAGSIEDQDTFTINEPELFGGDQLGTGGVVGTFRFFAGSNTQPASDYLAPYQDIGGKTPAYRGTCYLAPDELRTYVGNSTSMKPWKFEVRRTPNPIGLTANRHIVNSFDANPACCLYEILKSPEVLGIPAAKIDMPSFVTAGNTLFTEGNGFSFLLDTQEDASTLLRRLEEQIDGSVYFDPIAGKWKLSLVRADYDPDTIPELDEDNILEVVTFTRILWPQTKNEVRAGYFDRDDDYKETFAFAQDQANIAIQGGVRAPEEMRLPGVKDGQLAEDIAWRELRTLAFPLAQGRFAVTREFYQTRVGQVLALTHSRLDLTRLPMRVKHVDLGGLVDGKIVLELVQDVFFAATGSFGKPPPTGWVPPLDVLVPFPVDEQLAFEAPRALTLRANPAEVYTDKVYASARAQGVEVSYKVVERHSAGTPAGAFAEIGEVFAFSRIGELLSTLPVGSAVPLSTLTIVPTPDSQTALESVFADIADPVLLGTGLLSLLYVDGEFMLPSSAQTSGLNVQLNGVYRGVLDSVQAEHAAGTAVFLLFVGSGISAGTVPAGQNVHVKLLPRSKTDQVAEAAATQVAFTMADRTRRPYAPAELSLNGTRFASSASLEGSGTAEADGIELDILRRDFRTVDEVGALLADAGDLFGDYPTANTTIHEVDVIDDPAGAATLLYTHDLAALAAGILRRVDILKETDGAIPSTLGLRVRSLHVFESVALESFQELEWDFAATSALSGKFNFTALDTNDVSALFTVVTDVDHVFTLSSPFVGGNVEARINGGAFVPIIGAGLTTGSILAAAIAVSDTIEIRHNSTDLGAKKLLTMTVSAVLQGYAVLFV